MCEIQTVLQEIEKYKNISIECALQSDEAVLKELIKSRSQKLEDIMISIAEFSKQYN